MNEKLRQFSKPTHETKEVYAASRDAKSGNSKARAPMKNVALADEASPSNLEAQASDVTDAPMPEPNGARTVPRVVVVFSLLFAGLFVAVFLYGLLPRFEQQKRLLSEATVQKQSNTMSASYTLSAVQRGSHTLELALPGNIQAIQEFSIFARCDGYLKRRLVDIGDRVVAGQLLMEVDAPELEKQLKRALADHKQAAAQLKSAMADLSQAQSVVQTNLAAVKRLEAQIQFSTQQLARYEGLAQQGAVSVELRDQKLRDLTTDRASLEAANAAVAAARAQVSANTEKISAARANLEAAAANVEEVQTTNAFQKVLAPCAGTITERNVDAGALVSKGSSTNNKELLKMARTDTLRVFVFVPQMYYQSVFSGMPARITVAEYPNQSFEGKVAHISGGLDPTSRTLQAEIQIPNPKGKLMPGMFAEVKLRAERKNPPFLVPSSAIVVKADGHFVVTVESKSKAHFVPVKLGADLGKTTEVITGLNSNDHVLTQPTSDLREGQKITISSAHNAELSKQSTK